MYMCKFLMVLSINFRIAVFTEGTAAAVSAALRRVYTDILISQMFFNAQETTFGEVIGKLRKSGALLGSRGANAAEFT